MKYDFSSIEKKWQKKWLEEKPFAAVTGDKTREKFYGLIEFPYPSGQGLHVGHARPFTAMDIICRKKRMQGYNVLFPIGYDAFGLPTENYAVQHHIHPAKVTHDNIENFRKQLHMLGYSFDWDREVNTTDPDYYKWTQWIFLQMFKKGLAYKASMPVNWCTSCKIVLANEEVVDGVCERCGGEVIRKEKSQWMLAITKYADRLIDDLDDLDFIERVKIQQKNWIGRSTGAEVTFPTTQGDNLVVYTTRPDTLFGATYMVLAPEHPYIEKWKDAIANWDAVTAYVEAAAHKSAFERTELVKEKDYEILYLTDDVDEFCVRTLREYDGHEFKSVSDGDLDAVRPDTITQAPQYQGDSALEKQDACTQRTQNTVCYSPIIYASEKNGKRADKPVRSDKMRIAATKPTWSGTSGRVAWHTELQQVSRPFLRGLYRCIETAAGRASIDQSKSVTLNSKIRLRLCAASVSG